MLLRYRAEIPGLKGVYESGVPGVGVALMNDQGQRISGAGGVQCDSRGTPVGYVSGDGTQSFNFDVTLELVKTSDAVTSGTLVQSQTEFGIGVFGHEGIGSLTILRMQVTSFCIRSPALFRQKSHR